VSLGQADAPGCTSPCEAKEAWPTVEELLITDAAGKDRVLYEESNALLIGESTYQSDTNWTSLNGVPSEIEALSSALLLHGFHVRSILNATSSQIESEGEAFVRCYGYRRESRLLMYFAGHGHTRNDQEPGGSRLVGYLVPVDAKKINADSSQADQNAFLSKAIRMTRFLEWGDAIEARHALFIFDSCFSGAILGHRGEGDEERKPKPANYVLSDLASRPVRWYLTSGTANQTVPAASFFNRLLVQALTGERPEADGNHDGFLTSGELVVYLKNGVPTYNQDQTPDDGKLRDPLLDVGDMAFKLPERTETQALIAAKRAVRGGSGSLGVLRFGPFEVSGSSAAALDQGSEVKVPTLAVLDEARASKLATSVRQIESKDTVTWRKARKDIADLVGSGDPALVSELARGLPHGSYRYQLGVVSALANSPNGWNASDADAEIVRGILMNLAAAKDQTLRKVSAKAMDAEGKSVLGNR
jgi:hypothetical protein